MTRRTNARKLALLVLLGLLSLSPLGIFFPPPKKLLDK